MVEGGETSGRTVCRVVHGFPLFSAADPGAGISLPPGSCGRVLLHRSSAPAKNSNSVAKDNASSLQREWLVAEDVFHRLWREQEPSYVVEVHEELICSDAWDLEHNGDKHACLDADEIWSFRLMESNPEFCCTNLVLQPQYLYTMRPWWSGLTTKFPPWIPEIDSWR